MKELEFIKQTISKYVDLDVFVVGDIYYMVDVAKYQSVIVVCLSKDDEQVIFKVLYYIKGDFGITTYANDKFAFYADTTNLTDIHIYPVNLSFFVEPINMKLKVLSEIDLKML